IRLVTFTDSSGHAVVDVLDTGPGIPDSVQDRIFDPFFTTRPVGIGTGLGLSISRNIVSAIGGTITAWNRDGGGAAFRVTLPPATREPTPAPKPVAPAVATGTSGRAVVLIVDDEPAVGAAIRRALRGHDVTVVTSGRAALEHI